MDREEALNQIRSKIANATSAEELHLLRLKYESLSDLG